MDRAYAAVLNEMTTPDSTGPAPAVGCWLYVAFVTTQTLGVAIMYWKMLPLYRQLWADPSTFTPRNETRVWSLLAILLVQAGYWIRYHLNSPIPSFASALFGHVVLFLSRLVFTLGIAVYSFVFLMQRLAPHLPVLGYVLTMAGLFSLFLYGQELQRLGNACEQRRNELRRD